MRQRAQTLHERQARPAPPRRTLANHPTPSLRSRPPISASASQGRAQLGREAAYLDGPQRAPVSLRGESPRRRARERVDSVGEEPTVEETCASFGCRTRSPVCSDVCATGRHGVITGTPVQGMVISMPVGLVCFLALALPTGAQQNFARFSGAALASLSAAGVLHFMLGRYCNFRASQAAGVNLTAPVVQLNAGSLRASGACTRASRSWGLSPSARRPAAKACMSSRLRRISR